MKRGAVECGATRKAVAAVSLCMACAMGVWAANTTYYVDATEGNDGAAGTSSSTAWRTLGKINGTTFGAGDRILLKAGSVWSGSLSPRGSGAEGSPIVIDTFGTGALPIINGNGAVPNTFSLSGQSFWEVNNLELTNDDNFSVEDNSASRCGVLISGGGLTNHIHIKNCYIHDVDGNADGSKGTGGIIVVPDRINDLLIEGNTIRKVDRTGIQPRGAAAVHTNVVIRGNMIISAGGDAMIVHGCMKPLIEYNVADACCARCTGCNAGIWPWASDSSLFQFNEARNMVGGGCDRSGFDCDWKCRGTVFQYNYSHDNGGGFMLICSPGDAAGDYNFGSVVRYNISLNDRWIIFDLKGPATRGTQIYNNLIYVDQYAGTTNIVADGDWGGRCSDAYFRNNIFYVLTNNAAFGHNPLYTFDNNCYYLPNSAQLDPQRHTNALIADPMLVDPGAVEDGIHSLDGYKLQASSPCINRGIDLSTLGLNPGTRDYYDNPVPAGGEYDIGAHEHQGPFLPVCVITSPVDRDVIAPSPANVTITADAWHPQNTAIAKVEFFQGATSLGEDANGGDGWSMTWNNVTDGKYVLSVKVTDGNGESSVSSPVRITVGYRNPENPVNAQQGLDYKYYEGTWDVLPNFTALTPVSTGETTNFDLNVAARADYFGLYFSGYVEVPTDGIYTFYTQSDDGSLMFIGEELLVNNDGAHGPEEAFGSIGLKAGKHAIAVAYSDLAGGQGLLVFWASVDAGIVRQVIPPTRLFHGGTLVGTSSGRSETVERHGLRAANAGNAQMILEYAIPDGMTDAGLTVRLVDHRGRTVRTLISGQAASGNHTVICAGNVAPGQYLCVLRAGAFEDVAAVAISR